MTLFLNTRSYLKSGTTERDRDLFSRPGAFALHDADAPEAHVSRFNLEALTIGEVLSTGHDVEVREPIGISLVVPKRGRILSSTSDASFLAEVGDALLFSPNKRNTRVERCGQDKFLGVPVIVPAEVLNCTAASLGLKGQIHRQVPDFSLKLSTSGTPASQELIQLVNVLYAETSRKAPGLTSSAKQRAWAQLLQEKIVEVMHEAGLFSGHYDTGESRASRNVRFAQDYMNEHYPTIVGVSEIAIACGISIRSLQEAFRSVWSMTPQDMLLSIRLDAARQQLLRSDGENSVARIAFACGFTHLGRFSLAYREQFRERPSETLRRMSDRI